MNCLDYRRLLASGEAESADMKAHRLQCPACAEHLREHAAFERSLRDALEVPVPAGFERTLAHSALQRRRRFLAAASVAALAAGGGVWAWLAREDPLAMACIDFVMKEEANAIMMGAMPRGEAAAGLAATLPLERIERIGELRHIGTCPFNGVMAYHAVLTVPQGKVTLLVMPGAMLPAPQRATEHGMYARVVPLPAGSVGIVTGDAGVAETIAGVLRA
jgi:hypothetical protein